MRTTLAAVLLLLCPALASAAPFTWRVEGTIATVFLGGNGIGGTPFENTLLVGAPFTLTLNMESTAPDLDPNPHCGLYSPITSMQFQSGAVMETTLGKPSQLFSTRSADRDSSDLCLAPFPPGANGGQVRSGFGIDLLFSFDFGKTLATDALPTDTLGLFASSLDLFVVSPAHSIGTGRITSITAVPEPATLSLAAIGALALTRRRRR